MTSFPKSPIPTLRDDIVKLRDVDHNSQVAAHMLFRAQYGVAPHLADARPISIGIASRELADQVARCALKPMAAAHAIAYLGRELSRTKIELSALREAMESKPHVVPPEKA